MSFSKIIGHDKTIARLKTLLSGGRVPPALLFFGIEGTGKFLAAKEFAKALNCLHQPAGEAPAESGLFDEPSGSAPHPSSLSPQPVDDACDKCVSCLQMDSGAHPDARVIDAEFQGFLLDEDERRQHALKIDTVREFSRYVYRKNILSPWKVFIINDAHTLNLNAQNAMLKILEEPPKNTVFILVAAKKNLFLPTILSRSHEVAFKALGPAGVRQLLERSGVPPGEASGLAEFSGGSVKKARDIKKVRDRLTSISPGPAAIFRLAASLPKEPYLAREEARIMLDMLVVNARNKRLSRAPARDPARLTALIKKLLEFRKFLNRNVSHGLVLEAALLESEKLSVSLQCP